MSEANLVTSTPLSGWEYTLIDYDLKKLNAMAQKGWRLVAVTRVEATSRPVIILERALPAVTG